MQVQAHEPAVGATNPDTSDPCSRPFEAVARGQLPGSPAVCLCSGWGIPGARPSARNRLPKLGVSLRCVLPVLGVQVEPPSLLGVHCNLPIRLLVRHNVTSRMVMNHTHLLVTGPRAELQGSGDGALGWSPGNFTLCRNAVGYLCG